MRIVFADDDDVTMFLYRRLAKTLGLTNVHYAMNGLETLEWVNESEEPIDVLFLDFNMPQMNGLEFLKEHAKLAESQKIKRIFLMLGSGVPTSLAADFAPFKIQAMVAKPLTLEKIKSLLW